MSGFVWDLSQTGDCTLYHAGHLVFYVHFNVSMRIPSPIIPVTAVLNRDGQVHLRGEDLEAVLWNHDPQRLHTALERFGGMAEWKPRWQLLHVPAAVAVGGAGNVFYLTSPDRRSACRPRVVPAEPPPWGQPEEAWPEYQRRAEVEQEGRNARMDQIDYSHIPPLRIADRYAGGLHPPGVKHRRSGE